MSPKVPNAYLEARRAEILQAAVQCFLKKGFHNTTMQDIYKASNLSPGAVYNYFSSKEDIMVAAAREFQDWTVGNYFTGKDDIAVAAVEEINAWTLSQMAKLSSEQPGESWQRLLEFWLSFLQQDSRDSNISVQLDYYSEATRNEKIRRAVLESQDSIHDAIIEIIKQNQQAGLINPALDPLSIARAIMGIFFGLGIHKSLDPDVDIEAFSKVMQAMLTGTFAVPPKKHRKTPKRHPPATK